MNRFLLLLLLPLVFLNTGSANAHALDNSNLRLNIEGTTLTGDWDASVLGIAEKYGYSDPNPPESRALAASMLEVSTDGHACHVAVDTARTNVLADDYNIEEPLKLNVTCPTAIGALKIDLSRFFALDHQRDVFLNLASGIQTYSFAFTKSAPSTSIQIGEPERMAQFVTYLREGVWHIWIGFDHILFLISLLLPAALIAQGRDWTPRHGFKSTFMQVLGIVTAFTLAHSITLGLVIFGVISLPSQFVESVIALSIAVAAANNLYPVIKRNIWVLTFAFGLIHGMGFAGALEELGLPDNARWLALVGFNLGVEFGQAAIVLVVLPVIYVMRNSYMYRRKLIRILSSLIIAVAIFWFLQRAFGL